MITLSILLISLGNFVLYNTSKKVVLQQNSSIEKWLQTHTQKTKIIGLSLLVIALVVSILKFGITSGITFWLIALISILCLIITLYPTIKINYKYLAVLFIVLLIIEILIL